MKNTSETTVSLNRADAYKLQDAWHYAMMIIKRGDSGFDGDREFEEGIRGQMTAYERLLGVIDAMTEDNETWELVKAQWFKPATFADVQSYAAQAMAAINASAGKLGIDARTGSTLSAS